MFPLANRKLIRGCAAHKAAGLGCAADYTAVYVGFKIPFDGMARRFKEKKGGNWLRITRGNGDRIELAHLSEYHVADGPVKEGQNGGITGNSGTVTSGPHLHIQIFNKAGVRLDPEKYDWGTNSSLIEDNMLRTYKKTIYALVAGYWIAVATSYDDFVKNFGGQNAPEMTEAQFKAFPLHKNTIK